MLAPHVDYVKLFRSGTGNTAEIFSSSENYHVFLSAEEDICGSPLLELETFSKLSCRLCERRLTNYKSVIVTS